MSGNRPGLSCAKIGIQTGAVICKGLKKTCICGCHKLIINYDEKRCYTIDNEEINEGDIICVYNHMWSIGGNFIPTASYQSKITTNTLQRISNLVLPFSEEKNMRMLSIEMQIRVSTLIKVLKEVGIEK